MNKRITYIKKSIVVVLAIICLLSLTSTAFAKEEYVKKGFFDPPEKGDHVYKGDADFGFNWSGDQKCLLCHVDYPPNPPYKEWDWKDKYSLNANGKLFMDSGYQRMMVPGNTPLAQFLPEQNLQLRFKNHEEGGVKIGRGSVEKEGNFYVEKWAEMEKGANPSAWNLTPGYTYKDMKFKELWMKFDPVTGQGEHWGKLEIKVEVQRTIDGKV